MKKGMFDRGQEPPHRLLASKSKAPVTLKSIVLYVAIVLHLKICNRNQLWSRPLHNLAPNVGLDDYLLSSIYFKV